MRCPGQDKRYWSGAVIFEVPCPKCGVEVEIFQDESSGRCTGCGHKFTNPKRDLSCAEWCAYAEECLGYAPNRRSTDEATSHNLGEGALAGHLLQAAKDSLADKPPAITRTMVAFQHARALAAERQASAREEGIANGISNVQASSEELAAFRAALMAQQASIVEATRMDPEFVARAAAALGE